MKKQIYLLLAVAVVAALAGWGAAVVRFSLKKPMPAGVTISSPDRAPTEDDEHADDLHYADVIQAAVKFDHVVVWEGLPHYFEATSRARELATRKTFKIGDQYFYVQPLILTDEESTAMSDAVLKNKQNFIPWRGEKFCGGFHADYAIEWRYKGATLAQALICFGCEEAQFRVGNRMERVDQSEEGVKQFRALLSSHRQERPAFQLDTPEASARPPAHPFTLDPNLFPLPKEMRLPPRAPTFTLVAAHGQGGILSGISWERPKFEMMPLVLPAISDAK